MSPMVRGRKGAHTDVLEKIASQGLVRARVDGEVYLLEDVPPLAIRKNHTIEAVVDRIVLKAGIESRLDESTRLAIRLSEGMCSVIIQSPNKPEQPKLFSTSMACVDCGASFEELEPRTFSFNSPYGACPECDGLGKIPFDASDKNSALKTCPQCDGGRLGSQALAVTVKERAINDVVAMPLADVPDWMRSITDDMSELQKQVSTPICEEVIRRIEFLLRVGVDYLSLDRSADTLSGGELQRIRLATCIGSGLVSVCYVLDEPSIGLHPADHDRLLKAIAELKSQGNTIVIVEHDEDTMRAADHLIDIGPGAGTHGGYLVAQGTPDEVAQNSDSPTGQYLSRQNKVGLERSLRVPKRGQKLRLEGARLHNLQNVKLELPLGLLVGISGVSGSGKSSLIVDTLYPALAKKLGLVAPEPGVHRRLTGADKLDKLVPIDQSPIGRTSRSCPATYAGVLDPIRNVFAATRAAKTLGFKSARFSFNSPSGRCDVCKGNGFERIEMNFLSDLLIECSRCGGKRFNRQTLQVRFKGATIADVLAMTIEEAQTFFENVPKVHHLLSSLVDVGLGYVTLGQSSTTLSGGEAQRIKLATELARPGTGKTLYLLDEPTTGLHFADVQRLLVVLDRLVEAGNTVVVIEHQTELLAACDWLIDLGPGGGQRGGQIIATGSPQDIAACEESLTGRFLKSRLAS